MENIALDIDVLVVGGGPAGSAAARVLAAGGRSVTVVDKAEFPRDKCCGDGLTTLALRELEAISFDPATVSSWTDVHAAWLRSPSGREVCLPLRGNGRFAAVAPRIELDNALLEHARAAGATVLGGHAFVRFVEVEADAGAVEVEADLNVALDVARDADAARDFPHRVWQIARDGVPGDDAATDDIARDDASRVRDTVEVEVEGIGLVRARNVIAADGMWSPVRKSLGCATAGYLGEWHGFRQYATNVTGPAKDRLYVWFEPDLLPGYAWSFPLPDGRVNIGFGVLRNGVRKVQDMKTQWPDLLQRPHIREALGPDVEMEGRHTAWPIPARIDEATLCSGRVLFVGDAAAATDALTGEGIGQALLTGRLAAEAILAADATKPNEAGEIYRAHALEHLLADHRMSIRLGKILASNHGARGAVRIVDLNDWTRRNFARWMFEDEPRAIAVTPSRWHRRMFRRDGAFAND